MTLGVCDEALRRFFVTFVILVTFVSFEGFVRLHTVATV